MSTENKKIYSEKYLEKSFSDRLNKSGDCMVIKLLSTFVKGLPDRMVLCRGGYVGFAEIKTTGKKPTKIQEFIHSKLEAIGFRVFIVDDVVSRDEAISYFLNKVNKENNQPI